MVYNGGNLEGKLSDQMQVQVLSINKKLAVLFYNVVILAHINRKIFHFLNYETKTELLFCGVRLLMQIAG